MMPRLGALLWILLVALNAADAHAQQRLDADQRLRVSYECIDQCRRATGTLVELRSDTLVLAVADSVATYRLSDVTLLERSRGRGSYWARGTAIGAAVGTAAVFGALLVGGSNPTTSPCDPANNQDALGGPGACLGFAVVMGGLPGGLLGLIVGSRIKTERWEEVPMGQIQLGLVPTGDGLGLGVSVSF